MAKNSAFLELGPANVYLWYLPKASLVTANGSNKDYFLQAVLGGSAGNSIRFKTVDPGGTTAALSVSVSGKDITVSLARAANALVTTVDDLVSAINNDPAAGFLITAARKSSQDGTGIVVPTGVFTNLTGGSDTGVKTDVGYLGEGIAYQVTTEAQALTGAQKGNVPLDKVVIGGMVKMVVPFKEITLDNFKAGIPLTRLVENDDKSKRRLEFTVTVGLSLRSQAIKMTIAKIKGGFESADPKDIIVIPSISPAEGEVNFPYAPTTQREILANFYAWPDDVTGRWAFTGDEVM